MFTVPDRDAIGDENTTKDFSWESETRVEQPNRSRTVRLLILAVKGALSLALLWYMLSRYAPGVERFTTLDGTWYLLAVLAIAVTLLPCVERWSVILLHLGARANWGRIFQVFYASLFFTQILPSVGGDIVRILYHRALGARIGGLIISVLLDRGIAVASLFLLTVASVPYLNTLDQGYQIALPVGLLASGSLLGAYLCAILIPSIRKTTIWTYLPRKARALADSIRWALTSKIGLVRLLPLSLCAHVLTIFALFAIARALHIELGFWEVFGIGPVIILAQVVPISIAGWGVREAAAVFILTSMGIEAGSALALSIVYGLTVVLVTLPGLFFWIALRE